MIPETIKFPYATGSSLFKFGNAYIDPREIIGYNVGGGVLTILLRYGVHVGVDCGSAENCLEVMELVDQERRKPFYL